MRLDTKTKIIRLVSIKLYFMDAIIFDMVMPGFLLKEEVPRYAIVNMILRQTTLTVRYIFNR